MTSRYSGIVATRQSELSYLTKSYDTDTTQEKVNLSIQTYHSELGKPVLLPIVRHAELLLVLEKSPYLAHVPVLGYPTFTNLVSKLILGSDNVAIREGRAFSVQSASLCGALRMGAEFLYRVLKYKVCYVSKPCRKSISEPFAHAGFEVREYYYWSRKYTSLNFERMLEDIVEAPENSVIILVASAHNPTGCDLNREQWSIVGDIIKARNLFPFFVMSFQGMVDGDLDADSYAIRLFAAKGIELFSAQSYEAKFGLYCERTGNMTAVVNKPEVVRELKRHLTLIIRSLYSNPPFYSVKVIRHIVETPHLFQEWKNNLKSMAMRLMNNRKVLVDNLIKLNTPGDWSHVLRQKGVFCFTGLNRKQIIYLIKNKHIYLFRDGCINMSAITRQNIDYISKAIHEACVYSK